MSLIITEPTPFDEEFLADLPYDPSVLLFDQILSIDPAEHRVRCRMPTDRPIPFTDQQRAHELRHPRHVAGAAMICRVIRRPRTATSRSASVDR